MMQKTVYDIATGETIQVDMTPEEIAELEASQPAVVLRNLAANELIMGILHLNITPDMVDAAIAAMPEPDRTIAKWRWDRSQTFERDDWLINEMATVFGKTSEEVDDAWLYASSGI